MHEGAIAAALIQSILELREQEKFASIKTATVLIGRMHQVIPAVLQNHYRLLKKEYPSLAKSKLVIEIAPVAITCRVCSKVTVLEQAAFACPGCGSTDIEISGGREMHLKDITGTRSTVDGIRLKKKDKGKKQKAK